MCFYIKKNRCEHTKGVIITINKPVKRVMTLMTAASILQDIYANYQNKSIIILHQ